MVRILCFPWAGAGASGYRELARLVAPGIRLWPARLPGREDRFGEPAISESRALTQLLARAAEPVTEEPYALFGHSWGALMALAVAARLRERGMADPVRIFLSGCLPPGVPFRRPPLADLDDDALIATLVQGGGLRVRALEAPELRRVVMPALRADLEVAEDQRRQSAPRLEGPVTVLAGLDDPLATPDGMIAWRGLCTGPFRMRTFPGGHLFLLDAPRAVAAAISNDIAVVLG